RCEFCSLWKQEGGRYRTRPHEEVWHELATTERRRLILFTDENIYTDRAWALTLFRGMVKQGLRQPFAVQASLNIADDEEMLRALRDSGCVTVLIGFESLNEESLRGMRKGVNLRIGVAHYREKIERLHDWGLASSGTFIFGNDGDGPDIFARTVEFVLEAGMDVAHFGLLTPLPGTDLYDRLAREGRLLYTDFPADYVRYDLRTAVFRPLHMTPTQLEEGLQWATRALASWPVVLKRTWRTWRATRNPMMAAIALGWNRTGFYQRVMR
ncbi:MAG TPA: radical SAM protein, partial [Anaerolineae bacterium]|nr:radical SAM protein [Anaerolineae bacterium]